MNHPKPDSVTEEAWDALKNSMLVITEHFSNVAIFVNWVSDEGQTRHGEILEGNAFALRHHIEKYLDGDFLPDEIDDDDDDDKQEQTRI